MIASGPTKKRSVPADRREREPAGIARRRRRATSARRCLRLRRLYALLNSVQIRSRDRVPFAETFAETSFFTRLGGGKTSVFV